MHVGSTRFPTPVLVLGLGHDRSSDDAVGLHVARRVATLVTGESSIVVRESREPGRALLDELVGCENVLIVQAIVTGNVPLGFLHELHPASEVVAIAGGPIFPGIDETLMMGESLGLPMPHSVRVFAIEVGAHNEIGAALSPAIAAALAPASERIAICARACLARERTFAGVPE